MERIKFSDHTNRLRRNLVGAAFLVLIITYFDINVGTVRTSGIELENLTTGVLLAALVAFLVYHAIAFGVHAWEEYSEWTLKLGDEARSGYGVAGPGLRNLAKQMRDAGGALNEVIENSGAIASGDRQIFTKKHANQLIKASEGAQNYAKRMENFPRITRARFWVWDIGTAAVLTIFSVSMAVRNGAIADVLCRVG